MRRDLARYVRVALSVVGSAILLYACDKPVPVETGSDEALMTEYSEHLTVIMTRNGRRSYIFKAPLVEGYTLAKEPYREFRKGVEITTYQDDSLTTVDAVLTANYAIYYENRELWEAKGDVVVVKSDGKTLYTQQLFWNAKTKRIYSNVDTKIVQNDSHNVFQGEGFESDEEFKEWRFRRFTGKMDVDVSQMEADDADSLASAPEKEPEMSPATSNGGAAAASVGGEKSAKGSPAVTGPVTKRPGQGVRKEAATNTTASKQLVTQPLSGSGVKPVPKRAGGNGDSHDAAANGAAAASKVKNVPADAAGGSSGVPEGAEPASGEPKKGVERSGSMNPGMQAAQPAPASND